MVEPVAGVQPDPLGRDAAQRVVEDLDVPLGVGPALLRGGRPGSPRGTRSATGRRPAAGTRRRRWPGTPRAAPRPPRPGSRRGSGSTRCGRTRWGWSRAGTPRSTSCPASAARRLSMSVCSCGVAGVGDRSGAHHRRHRADLFLVLPQVVGVVLGERVDLHLPGRRHQPLAGGAVEPGQPVLDVGQEADLAHARRRSPRPARRGPARRPHRPPRSATSLAKPSTSYGRPCSRSRMTSSRSRGRARLPTWVDRMRSVLRCMVPGR